MQSQRQRAKHAAATAGRQQAHVDRRACFSGIGPSRCMPRDVQVLAAAIQTRTLPGLVDRHGNPRLGYVVTKAGHAGDDFERARRMVAKGMPHTELTDVYGVSRAPHLNADVGE